MPPPSQPSLNPAQLPGFKGQYGSFNRPARPRRPLNKPRWLKAYFPDSPQPGHEALKTCNITSSTGTVFLLAHALLWNVFRQQRVSPHQAQLHMLTTRDEPSSSTSALSRMDTIRWLVQGISRTHSKLSPKNSLQPAPSARKIVSVPKAPSSLSKLKK